MTPKIKKEADDEVMEVDGIENDKDKDADKDEDKDYKKDQNDNADKPDQKRHHLLETDDFE